MDDPHLAVPAGAAQLVPGFDFGDTTNAPLIPEVLAVGDRQHAYHVPQLDFFYVLHRTPHTVRGQAPGGAARSLVPSQVIAVPNLAAHNALVQIAVAYQAAFDQLAATLRACGRYDQVLAAAPHRATDPTPLTPTVIEAPDPDSSRSGGYLAAMKPPPVTHQEAARHTPKMLELKNGSRRPQYSFFCCPSEAAWQAVETAYRYVETIAVLWDNLVRRLGSYENPLPQGGVVVEDFTPPPSPPLPELPAAADLESTTPAPPAPVTATQPLAGATATSPILRLALAFLPATETEAATVVLTAHCDGRMPLMCKIARDQIEPLPPVIAELLANSQAQPGMKIAVPATPPAPRPSANTAPKPKLKPPPPAAITPPRPPGAPPAPLPASPPGQQLTFL